MKNRTRKVRVLNAKKVALLKMDPSRTLSLRRSYAAELQRRFARFKAHLQQWVTYHASELTQTAISTIPGVFNTSSTDNFPDIRQTKNWDCGAAACMSVGKHFGVGPDTLEEWRELLDTNSRDGTNIHPIIDALDSLGLHTVRPAEGEEWNLASLRSWTQANHVILCPIQRGGSPSSQDKSEQGHWVVVLSVDEDTGDVSVQDPVTGPRTIKRDGWLERWHDKDEGGKEYVQFGIAVGRADKEVTGNEFNSDQSRDDHGRFAADGVSSGETHGKSPNVDSKTGLFGKAVGGVKAAEHWAVDKVVQGVGKLPKPMQAVVRGAYAAAMASFTVGQALAERAARERGLSEEQAKKLRNTLFAVDALAAKPAVIAGGITGIGSSVGFIPIASAAYLVYSTARNPMATFRAAKGLISEAKDKASSKVQGVIDRHKERMRSLPRHGGLGLEMLNAEYKYASTQLNIEDEDVLSAIERLQEQLDTEDVLELETSPHITVRYGLTENMFCETGPGGGVDPTCSSSVTPDVNTKHTYSTSFNVGGRHFTFAARSDGTESSEWDVAFWPGTLEGGGSTRMTKDQNVSPIQVLRHVQRSLNAFIKERQPKVMIFTADKTEESRVVLYDRVAKEIEKHYGYTPTSWQDERRTGSKYYVLSKGEMPDWLVKQRKESGITNQAVKNDVQQVQSVLQGTGPIHVTLGKLSLFRNPDADVLILSVQSPQLETLHERLGILPNETTHKDYKPHLTIAYLKPGTGQKYVESWSVLNLRGKVLTFDEVTYSDVDRNHETVTLNVSHDEANLLADAIKEHGKDGDGGDFYLALLHVALDETGGEDISAAVELAAKVYVENPDAGENVENADPLVMQRFKDWLDSVVQMDILSGGQQLADKYALLGFRKGLGTAWDSLHRKKGHFHKAMSYRPPNPHPSPGLHKILTGNGEGRNRGTPTTNAPASGTDYLAGRKDSYLDASLIRPSRRDKVNLLSQRAFSDLEGVTDAMSAKMLRTMSEGMMRGKTPNNIARDLVADVDGIGMVRARAIAHTELVRATSEALLDGLEDFGVRHVGVDVEWKASGGACEECSANDGAVYSIEEARGLIPVHPHCSCSWVPVPSDNVDEETRNISATATVTEQEDTTENTEGPPTTLLDPSSELDTFSWIYTSNMGENQQRDENGRWVSGTKDTGTGKSPGDSSSSQEGKSMRLLMSQASRECVGNMGEGPCDIVSFALWKALGRPDHIVPYKVKYDGEDHAVLLEKKTGLVLDPTSGQYGQPKISSKYETPYSGWRKFSSRELDESEELLSYHKEMLKESTKSKRGTENMTEETENIDQDEGWEPLNISPTPTDNEGWEPLDILPTSTLTENEGWVTLGEESNNPGQHVYVGGKGEFSPGGPSKGEDAGGKGKDEKKEVKEAPKKESGPSSSSAGSSVATSTEGKWEEAKSAPTATAHNQPHADLHKEALRTGEVTDVKKLGDTSTNNANVSHIITLGDGSKAVFKPESGELKEGIGTRKNVKGRYFAREAAASDVADLFGMKDMVPATVVRDVKGLGKGSAQAFVPGAKPAAELDYEEQWDGKKDMARAAALDYVIGNQDRHNGNWLIKDAGTPNAKMILIDHGLSFPRGLSDECTFLARRLTDRAADKKMPVPPEIKNVDPEKFKAVLQSHGLSEREIKAASWRLRNIQRSDDMGQVRRRHNKKVDGM